MSDGIKIKVRTSQVQKMVITGCQGIDAVSVYLEDQGKRFSETSYAGKLTLTADSIACTYFWSHMGSPLSEFLQSADTAYLLGKLMQGRSIKEVDPCALEGHLREEIIAMRRDMSITKDQARELYDRAGGVMSVDEDPELFTEVLGNDWCMSDLPKRMTHNAETVSLAIDAMKRVLQEGGA